MKYSLEKELKKEIPAYGMIPWTGGTWSVTYLAVELSDGCHITGSLTGYGDFPFNEYPDLPVINFRDNDNVYKYLSANIKVKETSIIMEWDRNVMKLSDFLDYLKNDLAINIINSR